MIEINRVQLERYQHDYPGNGSQVLPVCASYRGQHDPHVDTHPAMRPLQDLSNLEKTLDSRSHKMKEAMKKRLQKGKQYKRNKDTKMYTSNFA